MAEERGTLSQLHHRFLPLCFLLICPPGLLIFAPGCEGRKGPVSGSPADPAAVPAIAVERLEEEGRWAEAAAIHREEALRLGPAQAEEAVKRAIVAILMGDRLEEAETFTGEVLRRDPSRQEALYYLGDGQRVLLHYEAARSTLRRLLELEPGHARGTLALAHVLARLGEPAEALPLFDRFLASPEAAGPLREQAELDRARALRGLGRNDEAAGALAAFLERSPDHPVALSEAAQVFFLLGKLELARGLRERFAWLSARGHQLSSDDETKLYARMLSRDGSAAMEALRAADRRELRQALEALERLAAASPRDRYLARVLARLQVRLCRFHDALRALAPALEAAEAADLLALQADALLSLGRRDEARAALRRASSQAAGGAVQPSGVNGASPRESVTIHLRAGHLDLEPGGDAALAFAAFDRAFAAAGGTGAGAADIIRAGAVVKGLRGDLRSAARELMALITRDPRDLESFRAFERVFGSKAGEPEVARVLDMKRALEEKRAASEARYLEISAKPFPECGADYLELAKLVLDEGNREEAVDLFVLASDLLPQDLEALRRAAAALTAPGELFLRCNLWRRILDRAPGDAQALESLSRAYLEAGLRPPAESAGRFPERGDR